MLQRFRAFFESLISPLASVLLRVGVTPNQVTVFGTLGTVVSALWFLPRGQFLPAVLVVTAFAFTDLLDGHMARASGKTSNWGAFLDSSMDRLGDAAIFGGLLLY